MPAIVSTTGLSWLIDGIEQPYSRNTAGACRVTTGGIIECYATDRQHRKAFEFPRYFAQFLQALWWAIGALRFSFKHWTKHGEIRTTLASRCFT
jgi:hypothetical protein